MKSQLSFAVFFLAGTIMLATSLILLLLYYIFGVDFVHQHDKHRHFLLSCLQAGSES